MQIATIITYSATIPDNLKKYELSNDADFKTSAKSAESGLSKLFDNNLDSYYQTSSSCPHTVTFTFTKPIAVTYFAAYRNSTDSSYCPEKNSFVVTLANGTSVTIKDQNFKKSTDWVLVEFIKCPRITKLMYSIDRNHSSGCDSRVRQIKLFSKVSFQELDPVVHRKMLIADVFHQLPKGFETDVNPYKDAERIIAPSLDRVAPDVILESEDGKYFQAHKFICSMLSAKLCGDIMSEKQEKSGIIVHKMNDVKSLFIRAILNFAYGNMNDFSKLLGEIESKKELKQQSPVSERKADYSRNDIVKVFGELVDFLEVSERYSIVLLSEHIEERIINIIESGISKHTIKKKDKEKNVKLNSGVFRYIGDIQNCPQSLLFKFTNFLSMRPDLLSDRLISQLTKTELACLVSIGSTRVKNQDGTKDNDIKEAFNGIFGYSSSNSSNINMVEREQHAAGTGDITNNVNSDTDIAAKQSDKIVNEASPSVAPERALGSVLTIRPGSEVRIRDNITAFFFGLGGITRSDIGEVKSVSEDGIVHVDFHKTDEPVWRGLLDEVEEV